MYILREPTFITGVLNDYIQLLITIIGTLVY